MTDKLKTIAKRQIRKQASDHDIADLVNLTSDLCIEILPANLSAGEIVEAARKEHMKEFTKARKIAFRSFVDNRGRNGHSNPERSVLFDEIVQAVQSEYPSWEKSFARDAVAVCRQQFDVAIGLKPVEHIGAMRDQLPFCTVCQVSRTDSKRLNLDTWEISPVCYDCAAEQARELK